jgi:hypothetical protein
MCADVWAGSVRMSRADAHQGVNGFAHAASTHDWHRRHATDRTAPRRQSSLRVDRRDDQPDRRLPSRLSPSGMGGGALVLDLEEVLEFLEQLLDRIRFAGVHGFAPLSPGGDEAGFSEDLRMHAHGRA